MKNKKNVIMIVMLVAIALMSMGYALFATQLNINSIGNITSTWNVYFASISNGTKVGNASNATTPSVSGTSANMNVNLDLPGDSMTYSLVLKNGGTVGAIIEDIDAKAEGSTGIIYTISGLKIGDKLAAGASKTITIKIEYDPNTSSQPAETYKKLTVTIDAVQDIGQSITSQTPTIEGEIGSLARAILNNNQIQSDKNIDFSKASAYLTYKEVHETTPVTVNMSSTAMYYYGSGYTFDKATGRYTLTGIQTIKWSSIGSNGMFTNYPYTCLSTSSTNCNTTLYKMTGYTSTTSGVGYKYTRAENGYAKNGDGLFYTTTNTEDNKPTYYFRGNVENNYVKLGKVSVPVCMYNGKEIFDFDGNKITGGRSNCYVVCEVGNKIFAGFEGSDTCADEYGGTIKEGNAEYETEEIEHIWRIVRVNEDGSIKLISTVNVVDYELDSEAGIYYNVDGGFYLTDGHLYELSSAKKELENWYEERLLSYNNLIADPGYCNDTTVYKRQLLDSEEYTEIFHGAYGRIEQNKPQFSCSNSAQDLFTTVSNSKGNKLSKYPIGLLTADEIIYAGNPYYDFGSSRDNYSNYLYFGTDFWTMTPAVSGEPSVWDCDSTVFDSNLTVELSANLSALRPVISLKSTVDITGGNGTKDNPYIIKTN